jgi:hypothetical protein
MPLEELYIDYLETGTEYFVESHNGDSVYKYKATFSHIDGCSAKFLDAYALYNGTFIKTTPSGTLHSAPYYIQFHCAKYYHKTCQEIRRKVEQKNETIYQKALDKILADQFCPQIHCDENGNPLFDENENYLNYKDVFIKYI